MVRRSAVLTLLLLLVLAAPAGATITRGWATGPSPKQVRALARAVKLDDGRVLVAAGGDLATSQYVTTAEIFDPVTNTWSQAAPMNAPRWGAVMVKLLDGRVLVAGGQSMTAPALATAEVYDPRTNRWSNVGPMSQGRYVAAATLLRDGTVLVTGGWTSWTGTGAATAERFDPATNGWTPQLVTTFPGPRGLHAVAPLHDGQVLIAGGRSDDVQPKTTATFTGGAWTPRGETFWTRLAATLTTLPDGRVLAAGGSDKTTERYDPASGYWTPGPAMVEERSEHSATLLTNGKVLLVGGQWQGRMTELYDPVSNTLAPAGNLATGGRQQHTATLLDDGRVLVMGGFGGADPGVEIWTPTATLTTEPAVALGDAVLGAGASGVVQVTNTGDSPLITEGFTLGGPGAADFTIDAGRCRVVAAGATCAVDVRLTPSALGARAPRR